MSKFPLLSVAGYVQAVGASFQVLRGTAVGSWESAGRIQ